MISENRKTADLDYWILGHDEHFDSLAPELLLWVQQNQRTCPCGLIEKLTRLVNGCLRLGKNATGAVSSVRQGGPSLYLDTGILRATEQCF